MKQITEGERKKLIKELGKIGKLPKRSSKKTKVMAELVAWMDKLGFLKFRAYADGVMYKGAVGEYTKLNIKNGKRGYLGDFAGRRVIVICIGSGSYFSRNYMVGAI